MYLPHGVLVGGWQAWVGGRRAAGCPHDAVRQQEIPEQGCHQQVLRRARVCLSGSQHQNQSVSHLGAVQFLLRASHS